jgi:predicted acetyltransferase
MTADFPVRPITEDEFSGFYGLLYEAFHDTETADSGLDHELITFERDRSLAAFDGPDIVATAGAYSFQMTVPGAVTSVAGVSQVGVRPGYRRRGLVSGLLRRQFADIASRGAAVAALWASESNIYGRFGYGPASFSQGFTMKRGEHRLAPQAEALRAAAVDAGLRLRATSDPARADLAPVYDAVARTRPGMYARNQQWWESTLDDPETQRRGATALRCVVAEDDAGPRGYGLYRVTPHWGDDGLPAATLTVRELFALDPAACAAVWTDLLTRDLVGEIVTRMRPLDDPLPDLLADRRRTRPRLGDALWVRLVDVPGALAQRRYAGPVDTVLDVTDDLIPANQGRFRLRAAGPGEPATCEPVSADADVALPVSSLGAVYLGGVRLGELAAAGLATELRPGTLAPLSTALTWDPAPWCPNIF